MKQKYGLLNLLALSCILCVCVTVIMSCSLHKSSPIDVGRNSEPAVVSSGGYYEANIQDSKQGIVSIDHPLDNSEIKNNSEIKRLQGDCNPSYISDDFCIKITYYNDVKPTDWAFQPLLNLVERYGVIQVYSDKTFRGDRAATRYEVADMLVMAMDRMNQLLKLQAREYFSQKSFINLAKSVEEQASELATLRGRAAAMESRLAVLEKLKAH